MNTEEELFFPTLTVGQTMDFATRLTVMDTLPKNAPTREAHRKDFKDFLLRSVGISHTADTKVGNEFIRGVSGGERKRVSIIETLCTKASVICWDNSTRGLDASTALDFIRALRSITNEFETSTIVTLYQAGNDIYNLFDKVLVIDEGKQIFYGPRSEARPFMESFGFVCDDGANVSDFLTGVTVPSERKIRPGWETRFPRNGSELRDAYYASQTKPAMDQELMFHSSDVAKIYTQEFVEAVRLDQARSLPKSSSNTVSFVAQTKACITRQYQIIWGDKPTFFVKQGTTLLQAIIGGSLFYNAASNSSGLFIRSGTIFLALLYHALLAMSEVTDSFFGRPILAKHKHFAFYNPAAFCISQIVADVPILFIQVTPFMIILYFMAGLKATAGAFFTTWFFVYLSTFVMTAFFRMIGAAFPTFDAASKASGFAVGAFITYIGYLIPKPEMYVEYSTTI